uniref:C2H2-type domain-containing protein n=1 Tax=Sparus aurata TaxID=8175 RepID=A0A671YFB4_SPAAU
MRTNDLEHHKKIAHVHGAAECQRSSSLLCDFCGKEFKCKSQLTAHFRTHTGERPHLCDICGRKFGRQYQLKRHKILVHANRVNSEENPSPDALFACAVCGKRLKSEAMLAAHSRIHSGDKPHRCSICLRSFQRATCLKQHHVRVHLRVRVNEAPHAIGRRRSSASAKEFPCPICGKVFKFKSLLASHSLTHSEVRPYGYSQFKGELKRQLHKQAFLLLIFFFFFTLFIWVFRVLHTNNILTNLTYQYISMTHIYTKENKTEMEEGTG